MLHLIAIGSVDESIMHRVGGGDIAVLMDSAIIITLNNGGRAAALSHLMKRARCCVLAEQLSLYGIISTELVPGIDIINYSDLVNLTLTEPLIQTWG